MAHLWFRGDEEIWSAMPLDGHAVNVSVYPPRILAEGFRLGKDALAAVVRAEAVDSPVWVLVIAGDGDVRVNGFAPVAGLRVLQDRDEIRAAISGALFFSTETPARVQKFAATERTIFCGRCRQPMRDRELGCALPTVRHLASPDGKPSLLDVLADVCLLPAVHGAGRRVRV